MAWGNKIILQFFQDNKILWSSINVILSSQAAQRVAQQTKHNHQSDAKVRHQSRDFQEVCIAQALKSNFSLIAMITSTTVAVSDGLNALIQNVPYDAA